MRKYYVTKYRIVQRQCFTVKAKSSKAAAKMLDSTKFEPAYNIEEDSSMMQVIATEPRAGYWYNTKMGAK